MIYKSIIVLMLTFNICHSAPSINKIDYINVNSELTDDLENWMSLLSKELRTIPLNLLAIPGSHDSFTVDITKDSDVSPDGEDILKKLDFLTIVRTIMANWSKTQGYNVLEQLKAGIRFFDLRLCRNYKDDKLYFCHSMYSTEVTAVLSDMVSFLESHPKEVVILDCQHFYNFTTATHDEVIQLLKVTFNDKLVPFQSTMSSITLENLAEQKKQVLVIYRDQKQANQDLLWPSTSFPTPWYDTMNTSNLITDLNSGLQSRSYSSGYISQLVLTPSVDDYLQNLLTTLKKKCAVDFAALRTEWIRNQTAGQNGVNIIIADFIDINDNEFSKAVISLNTGIDTAKVHNYGLIYETKRLLSSLKYVLKLIK
ncbi:PI-PLC X domain-containing protein 3-like [Anthonomus grandis grandis]|uniref:PI-PLC X domain-containing protein 3-like n=1 Tax=Anthonomus grandis grandis TaxID=2921223 RepID=UPI00216503C4|nr:PI-PLC X domain-containing protein 3-like [Anthonomus grandis grandis]